MSYAAKANRPDSKDVAALRKEYEKKATEFRDSKDPASKAALRDAKEKAFQRVVTQMNHERAADLREEHKVLTRRGLYRTDEQIREERAKAESQRQQRIGAESRL